MCSTRRSAASTTPLEYVSDRLAELILDSGGVRRLEGALPRHRQAGRARRASASSSAVDPILDHASFSPERAQAHPRCSACRPTSRNAPSDFVQRYAEHSKLEVQPKGAGRCSRSRARRARPDAGARPTRRSSATFSRTYALDHEDVEFLSFGHPLVEQALDWAREAHDASAALAMCRGFDRDGAVFLWRYGIDLPDDVPEVGGLLRRPDLHLRARRSRQASARQLEDLLDERAHPRPHGPDALAARASPLARLVDTNHAAAEQRANAQALDVCRALQDRAARRRSPRSASEHLRGLAGARACRVAGEAQERQRREMEARHDSPVRRPRRRKATPDGCHRQGSMPRCRRRWRCGLMRAKHVSGVVGRRPILGRQLVSCGVGDGHAALRRGCHLMPPSPSRQDAAIQSRARACSPVVTVLLRRRCEQAVRGISSATGAEVAVGHEALALDLDEWLERVVVSACRYDPTRRRMRRRVQLTRDEVG